MIDLFCVIGTFKGHLADRRYELSQGRVDPVVVTVYFHVASFRENRNDPKLLLKRGADTRKYHFTSDQHQSNLLSRLDGSIIGRCHDLFLVFLPTLGR